MLIAAYLSVNEHFRLFVCVLCNMYTEVLEKQNRQMYWAPYGQINLSHMAHYVMLTTV